MIRQQHASRPLPAHKHRLRPAAAPQNAAQVCAALLQAGVELKIDDFQRVSDQVPFIADLKPSGRYVMEDVHKARPFPFRFPFASFPSSRT
jgi:Dehydratase family